MLKLPRRVALIHVNVVDAQPPIVRSAKDQHALAARKIAFQYI
jgi:hypothetical protein